MENNLKEQIATFNKVWKGGYYEGNPEEPLTLSSYGEFGYISVLRATYLRCIKPYITSETTVLEIGPGRGAWTKTMLEAKEVWALDAVSAETSGFWKYVGQQTHVKYIQVEDFSCRMLPENYFDYMFSFGCLCHVPFAGIEQYAENLFPKLKSGSNCFWLVADYEKFNQTVNNPDKYSIWRSISSMGKRFSVLGKMLEMATPNRPQPIADDIDENPSPGRWFHAGIEKTCKMLESKGYKIIDKDVETSLRDPIIHFMKQ